MTSEWILAWRPLTVALGFHSLAIALAFPLVIRLWKSNSGRLPTVRPYMALVVCSGFGIALLGWFSSLLGVLGLLRLGPFALVVGLWLAAVWWPVVRHRHDGAGRRLVMAWRGSGPGTMGDWIGSLIVAAIALNITLGGLHHDMNQDPMWYHLALPGQWALTGRLDIFPWQMNSAMPLSTEAFSTVLLLCGGEVSVTTFYAMGSAALCAALPLMGRDLGGRGGGWAALVMMLFFAMLAAIAPMPAKNDNLAALQMLAGAVIIWEVHLKLCETLSRRGSDDRWIGSYGALAGFLFGASVTCKLTSAPLVLPAALAGLAIVAAYRSRALVRLTLMAVLGGAASILPFAVRNIPMGVSPLHPIGAGLFPGNPMLEPALRISASHEVYPLSMAGLTAMLHDLPEKLTINLAARDVLLPALTVLAAFGLLNWRRPPLIPALAAVGGGLVAFAWMKGFNNIGRYLVTAYPMAVPLVAWAGRELRRHLSSTMAFAVLVLFLGLGIQGYVSRQWAWSQTGTIQWSFRPEISEASARASAKFREKGPFYILLRDVAPHVPHDALVMMPDIEYPFYLGRRALWADELSRPLLPGWFRGKPESEWPGALGIAGVTHVLMRWPAGQTTEANSRLVRACSLIELNAHRSGNPAVDWVLYRVPGPDAPTKNPSQP